MQINDELQRFREEVEFLKGYRIEVYKSYRDFPNDATWSFLAEAVLFRLYRASERLMRSIFLNACVSSKTAQGAEITSRLSCSTWHEAEDVLKASGAAFLDWGNPSANNKRADIIFDGGFPFNDIISPVHSALVDLHRLRNYTAHDSQEARRGFEKALKNYSNEPTENFVDTGSLLIYVRSQGRPRVLTLLASKIEGLPDAYDAI